MNRIYLDRAERVWVEAAPTAVVVSWPHGHKALPYEVTVPDLLAVIAQAVQDTYEPIPRIPYSHRLLKHDPNEDHPGESCRGAVRSANQGAKQ